MTRFSLSTLCVQSLTGFSRVLEAIRRQAGYSQLAGGYLVVYRCALVLQLPVEAEICCDDGYGGKRCRALKNSVRQQVQLQRTAILFLHQGEDEQQVALSTALGAIDAS